MADPILPEPDVLIHEPARLRVLALLVLVEQADFMYLLRQTGLSRGNLSVQLGRLESAGILSVKRRVEGTRTRSEYRVTRSGLAALKKYRRDLEVLLEALPL